MIWTQTTKSWPLSADAATVFRELTESERLTTWFAEHAEVDPRPGGPYRFWGRHTPGTPGEDAAMGRVEALTPDERLVFTWPLLGADTTVHLGLESSDGTTIVTAEHTVGGSLGVPRERELLDDFWRLSFGNLMMRLHGGELLRPDFADPSPDIRLSVFIEAPPEAVFRTLTEPELVNHWTGSTSAEIDLGAGVYRIGWEYEHEGRKVVGGPRRIVELVPGRKLVVDWPDWRGDESVTGQTITFTLTPEGQGTRVELVHGGFGRVSDLSDYPFGWSHFLEEIGKVATELV